MTIKIDNDDLLAQLADEYTARIRTGEAVDAGEYIDKHPQLAGDIGDLFPTILAVEGLKEGGLSSYGSDSRVFQLGSDHLGEFQILREVGRGGMGIVYEAVQESLSRRVALKLLPPAVFVDETQVRRFQREAETASRLHHPNIVPIYDVGKTNGIYHYSMQFIDGPSLEERIRDQRNAEAYPSTRSDFAAIADLGRTAAAALHYAHTNGVLHRDVKPSNLLLQDGEQVMMTDFGIAKMLDDPSMTRTGEFLGTIQYAAPELFGGQYDLRSDIYGLGLTLYELVTLRRAHEARSQPELIGKIHSHAAPDPTTANPRVPRDLATIIGKACAYEPNHRYESAGALADDLQCFLDDRPISARPVTALERTWRWCRRNPLPATTAAFAAIAFIVASVVGWLAYVSTDQSLQRERIATATAQENLEGQRQAARLAQGNLALALEAFDDLFNSLAGKDHELVTSGRGASQVPVVPAISANELEALQRLLEFYDRFAIENVDNGPLQEARARALRRVGDINVWLGDKTLATAAYRRSLRAYEEAQRDGAALLIDLAVVHKSLGHALGEQEDLTGAMDHLQLARELLASEVAATGSARGKYELARAHNVSNALRVMLRSTMPRRSAGALWSHWSSRWPRTASIVKEHHDEAVALANSLLAQSPDNQEFQLLLARTQRISAEYLFLSADLETATEQIGEATEILDRLSIEFLEVPNYRLELVETYLLVATHHPDLREAEERCGVAVTRSGQLVADYPEVPRYHEVNARALREHGRLLQRLAAEATVDSVARHQLQDRARRTFAASVTACEGLQQRFPFARQYVSELLETRIAVARMAMECADDQGARAILERAMTECEDGPVGMVPLARRAKLYRELTRMFRDLGESEFADKASRAAFRASREAMRQGIVQGISLVTSRLWSR